VETELPEGHVELDVALGERVDFVAEALERLLQLVSQLPLRLLGGQVVAVMHVLVFSQVGSDLPHLGVELHVLLLLLAKQDGILKSKEISVFFSQSDE
jgi:hypothetical protein